jgi:hypothetical protein
VSDSFLIFCLNSSVFNLSINDSPSDSNLCFSNMVSSFHFLSKWVTSTLEMDSVNQAECKSIDLLLNLLQELIQLGNMNSATSVIHGMKKSSLKNEKLQTELTKSISKFELHLGKKKSSFIQQRNDRSRKCVPCILTYLQRISEIGIILEYELVFFSLIFWDEQI